MEDFRLLPFFRFSALVVSILLYIGAGIAAGQQSGAPVVRPNSKAAEFQARFEKLPLDQKGRIQAIVAEAAKGPAQPSAALQKEFQSLLKAVVLAPPDAQVLHDIVLAPSRYQLLVLQDGLASLRGGRLSKSPDRAQYERRLSDAGVLTEAQIAQSQQTVEKLMKKEAVGPQGATLDEPTLEKIVANLTQVTGRIEVLFAAR